MGSIDKALPHAGFYPDSQNTYADAAKISIFYESSKKTPSFYHFFSKFAPLGVIFSNIIG